MREILLTSQSLPGFAHLIPEEFQRNLLAGELIGSGMLDDTGLDEIPMAAILCREYNGWMEIVWLAVDPDYQGTGTAEWLLDLRLRSARLKGAVCGVIADLPDGEARPAVERILSSRGFTFTEVERPVYKVNQFMNHRYRRADGSSYKIPNSAAYRDSAQFAKPIGQTADVTQEEMYNLCDNFHILKEGKHLDGTDAGENQPKAAMARELELQRAAYREIREYTDARPEIFHNPNFSQKDFSKAADDFFLVHSKVQCMNVRGHALLSSSLFSGLSKEEQEEMKEMDAFSHGVMWFIRNIQNDVSSGFMKDEHWTDTSRTMEDRIERYRKTGK